MKGEERGTHYVDEAGWLRTVRDFTVYSTAPFRFSLDRLSLENGKTHCIVTELQVTTPNHPENHNIEVQRKGEESGTRAKL